MQILSGTGVDFVLPFSSDGSHYGILTRLSFTFLKYRRLFMFCVKLGDRGRNGIGEPIQKDVGRRKCEWTDERQLLRLFHMLLKHLKNDISLSKPSSNLFHD